MENSIPRTLREEIRFVLNPENSSLFKELSHCPCCESSEIESYFTKYGYNHSICRKCQFVFVNPTPKDEYLNVLYEADLYKKIRENIEIPRALRGDEYASLSISKSDALEIIDRVSEVKSEGYWLDIGGGIGSFLNLAKKHRLQNWQLYLLEYNSVSAAFAKDHFKINVLENIEDLRSKGIKFDVISLIAVLEHISDPRGFLISIRELLKKDGLLVINIPHFPLSLKKFKQEYTYFLPPYHLSLFNEFNINLLLRDIGFETKQVWQNGSPAFVFHYLFPFAERIDSKIPDRVTDRVEYFFSPPLNGKEKLINKLSSAMNILLYPIRKLMMPKTFLNVIAAQHEIKEKHSEQKDH